MKWAVVVELPTVEVYAPIYRQIMGMVILLGIITLITVFLGMAFSRRIMLPVHRLNYAASQIQAGQFGVRVVINANNELGVLARTFNQMATQLEELYMTLEQKVATRTRRLELVAMLSEQLTAILNFEHLLSELVRSVKENFGYYHVHIYLFDNERENLVMAEGTGEPGEIMKRQRHHIAVNQRTSLVARAARTAQIVRVDNVRMAADWLPNPLLPQTFSEMAVPIVLDNQVMGVLDVQQDRIGGLDDSDENLLRSLANQVAIALRNARLFNETQHALEEMRAYQERYVQQTWDREKILRRNRGRAQFSLGESTTLQDEVVAAIRQQIMRHKSAALVQIDRPNGGVWAAPIYLEQSVIGSLQLYGMEETHQWSEGELALIKAVIDQVAQSAESLRLVEEVQEQASRQRLISQIGDKLRRAPDMDTLMEITVSELSRLLRPARTFVQLDKKE
jgi:GAF domain-containing protein/HAMP domain-containing protein